MLFDTRVCTLGEGPLWHPLRQQFFWFDIMEKRLMSPGQSWDMGEHVSAAGWVDNEHLLIASQSALFKFNIDTGAREKVADLEAENPVTRSNDGRADPYGGFWIGTMGIGLEADAGALYRYYRGEVRQLEAPITIPNSTCFTPDGGHAYFSDTSKKTVWRVALDASGWPTGTWKPFLDVSADGLNPDGAVVDAEGNIWIAFWGSSCVDGFDPQGRKIHQFDVPALQVTCPAFGGADLGDMLVTSAAEHLPQETLSAQPDNGKTFLLKTDLKGQQEHQVIL